VATGIGNIDLATSVITQSAEIAQGDGRKPGTVCILLLPAGQVTAGQDRQPGEIRGWIGRLRGHAGLTEDPLTRRAGGDPIQQGPRS
jgi:hypothetical protein